MSISSLCSASFVLALGLFACGGGKGPAQSAEPASDATAEATPDESAPAEPADAELTEGATADAPAEPEPSCVEMTRHLHDLLASDMPKEKRDELYAETQADEEAKCEERKAAMPAEWEACGRCVMGIPFKENVTFHESTKGCMEAPGPCSKMP